MSFCKGVDKKMIKNKNGFTLAEVLITLGIIGVVAALTIPTLMKNYEKIQYVTAFKNSYATFQNGIRAYIASENCTDLTSTGLFAGAEETKAYKLDELSKIFKGMNDLGSQLSSFKTKTLGGANSYSLFNSSYPVIQTVDGAIYNIQDSDSNNCEYNSDDVTDSKLKNYCAAVIVDTNGQKNPNVKGRDVFIFILANNGLLYPVNGTEYAKTNPFPGMSTGHWKDDVNYCTYGSDVIDSAVTGNGCAARIMEEGWQMKY